MARKPSLPLSIDWEDWFQLCCAPYDQADALDTFECRLPLATEKALALCDDLGAKATWFCLADQARRHPDLLRRIHAAGHRIGLHGMTHRHAFLWERKAFAASIAEGRAVLEDITGTPVAGFRAPEWSLRGGARDYWQEVADAGFQYDSSRAPLAYLGSPDWPRSMHALREGFWECPPPVAGAGVATVPLWGWGMRLLPRRWLRRQLRLLAERGAGTPVVLHPWELDEEQPPLPVGSRGHRFAHSAGLPGYGERLRWMLKDLELTSIETFLERRG